MLEIETEMEKEFKTKYYDKTHDFTGLLGPIKKIKAYQSINYDKVDKIIEKYKNEIKKETKEQPQKTEEKHKQTTQENTRRKVIDIKKRNNKELIEINNTTKTR